jgi:acyl-CoA synthetase (AMP-forming)/AMP-acid ligase II/fucose 4-O-acetylase-like acetyltransferase
VALPTDEHAGNRVVPFARSLAAYGDRVALVTADGELSYGQLASRVTAMARRLGDERRLVLLACGNDVDSVVVYLAAMAAGHPVLLAPGDRSDHLDALVAAYDPDVVARVVGGHQLLDERREASAHRLHPDLALLLSTSGSTGSPKLVRLSHENVQSNAESIATYLDIRDTDRAATTLPMHYCYGLSVINSHLLRGAGLILTDLSVTDRCFWELFRRGRGSTFAAVPYTFDLLDRVGFATMRLPDLRYVTQAGGRLTPDRVRRYAALGRRNGWDLVVMYGQTEATARMAYLPPAWAESRPQAIGVPIPGGAFRLEPCDEHPGPEVGELVYTGRNVMLGYAETPADLGLGRTVGELYTGDVARRIDGGLYEIVGRRSRFVKVFGLRIDLQRVEAMLDRHGLGSCCVGDADELVVAVQGDGDTERIRRLVARHCGLPVRAVRVCPLDELPRLPTGKPDHRAVQQLARASRDAAAGADDAPGSAQRQDLRALFAEILDRSDVTEDSSFVSLGGDSLSYVEMSLRLEQALGHLPADWHTLPIRHLRSAVSPPVTRRRVLDTTVALRAVSIVLIVGTHIGVFTVRGGAHLLLGVAGYNFARFHLTSAERRQRTRHLAASIARIAIPSMAWIALALLLTGDYDLSNVLLLNEAVGPRTGAQRYFWFIETIVYVLVALAAVFAIPFVDRLERRRPFGLPVALLAGALLVRYDVVVIDPADHFTTPVTLFWFFAIGWCAAKATTGWHRLWVSAAVVLSVPGFFITVQRQLLVLIGLLVLVWVPSLPGRRRVNQLAGLLATSSLYIYLTHWQVYPHLENHSRLLALLASLAAGVAYALAWSYLISATTSRCLPWSGWRRTARRWAALARGPRSVDGTGQAPPATVPARPSASG